MTVQLMRGDCVDLLRTIPDKSIDAVITDPPYNVMKNYSDYSDNKTNREYKDWCSCWINELIRVSDFVMFSSGLNNISLWYEIKPPDNVVCWYKPNAMLSSKYSVMALWEPFLVYGKPKQKPKKDAYNYAISPQKDTGNHPCPKPIGLFRIIVEDCTNQTDTILDPFMGSGTTGVACVQTGRNFIGCEIDPGYFKIAEKRIHYAEQQARLF
jgi:DNA modification methylase